MRSVLLLAASVVAIPCLAQPAEDSTPRAASERESFEWRQTASLTAAEARQAAAADQQFIYAIGSREIAKYDRKTGERVALSIGAATHLNSGFFWQGQLYCAHSNYPARPELSEILVLDPVSMKLSEFHRFAAQPGSLTWAVRHDDAWWCNFAFYDADNAKSYLARFDDRWKERARWTYPAELVAKLGRHSLSGGLWYGDELLATDHDNPVIYRLRVPTKGEVLELVAIEPAPFAGQGIAVDPLTAGLVGVVRKKSLVVFAERWAAADR
ncbi:MAG: hypothetical protein AB7U73_22930 [Pirellulales bacterium]